MRKMKRILVLTLTAAVTAAGCQSIQEVQKEKPIPEPTEAAAPQETETPEPTETETPAEIPDVTPEAGGDMVKITVSKKIVSADGAYQIEIPEEWEDMQDQINAEFSIEVGSLNEGAFLMVNGEDKAGSVLKDSSEYSSTLAGYVAGKLSDHQIGERIEAEIDGKVSYKQKISGRMEDTDIVYWVYVIDGTNQFIQVNAWSDADHADRAELFFDQIVNSFREITPGN